MPEVNERPLVQAIGLTKHFPVRGGLLSSLLRREEQVARAVDGVSFDIRRGSVFGLVGESGSGKSTTARLVLRLIEPTAGQVIFDGVDMGTLKPAAMRSLRSRMQIVFQDPMASLNPRMTIGAAIEHPARIHMPDLTPKQRRERVIEMLEAVQLSPGRQYYDKYPHQISGGQRQRVVIARALVTNPDLIVADEPVAMADVSVRALLLELMMKLKEQFDLTYLFITHDLATAKYVCDDIAIMYLGKIVEQGPLRSVFREPSHPYTRALLDAVPVPDPKHRRNRPMPAGEIPSALNPPSGCRFHPRCPIAATEVCPLVDPELRPVEGRPEHLAACHLRTGAYQHLDPER